MTSIPTMKSHQKAYSKAHRYQEISASTTTTAASARTTYSQSHQQQQQQQQLDSSNSTNHHHHVSRDARRNVHERYRQAQHVQQQPSPTTRNAPLSPTRSSAFSSPLTKTKTPASSSSFKPNGHDGEISSPTDQYSRRISSSSMNDKSISSYESLMFSLSPGSTINNNDSFEPVTPGTHATSCIIDGSADGTDTEPAVAPPNNANNLDSASPSSSSPPSSPRDSNEALREQPFSIISPEFVPSLGPRGSGGYKNEYSQQSHQQQNNKHYHHPVGVTTARSAAASNVIVNRRRNNRLQATMDSKNTSSNAIVGKTAMNTAAPSIMRNACYAQHAQPLQNQNVDAAGHAGMVMSPLPDPPGSVGTRGSSLDRKTSDDVRKQPDPPSARRSKSTSRLQSQPKVDNINKNANVKAPHPPKTRQPPPPGTKKMVPVLPNTSPTTPPANVGARSEKQAMEQLRDHQSTQKPELGIVLPLDHHDLAHTGSLVSADSFGPRRNDWNPDDNDIEDEISRAVPSANPSSYDSPLSSDGSSPQQRPPSLGQHSTTPKCSNINGKVPIAESDMVNGREGKHGTVSSSLNKAIDTLKSMVPSQYFEQMILKNTAGHPNASFTKQEDNEGGVQASNITTAVASSEIAQRYPEYESEEAPDAVDTSTGSLSIGGSTGPNDSSSRSGLESNSGLELDLKELVDEIRSYGRTKNEYQYQDKEPSGGSEEKKDDDDGGIQRHLSNSTSVDSMGQPIPAALATSLPPRSDIHKPVAAVPTITTSPLSVGLGWLPSIMSPIMQNLGVAVRSPADHQPSSPVPDVAKNSGTVTPIMRMRHPEVIAALEESFINKTNSSMASASNDDDVNDSETKAELNYQVSKQKKWKEKIRLIERKREEEKRALTVIDYEESSFQPSSRASRSMKVQNGRGRSRGKKSKSKQKRRSGKGQGPPSVCTGPASAITGMLDTVLQSNCGNLWHTVLSFGDDDHDDDDEDDDDDDDEGDTTTEEDEGSTESLETENLSYIDGSRATDTTRQNSTDGESETAFSRSTKTSLLGAAPSSIFSSDRSEAETSRSGRHSVVTLTERSTQKHQPAIGIRDKNFIRAFITEITRIGIPLLLHKKSRRQSLSQPTKITAFIKMGNQGEEDGEFSVPSLIWQASDCDQVGSVNLFEVKSLEKGSAFDLENYPLAMPGRSLFLRMNQGRDYVFETNHENTALRLLHGLRWVIARFSFNLIIGNLSVSCELLAVDRSVTDDPDGDGGKFPRTLKEEAQWTKAMNDATNQLIDASATQLAYSNDKITLLV